MVTCIQTAIMRIILTQYQHLAVEREQRAQKVPQIRAQKALQTQVQRGQGMARAQPNITH